MNAKQKEVKWKELNEYGSKKSNKKWKSSEEELWKVM